jgi:hypothetical protein
MLRALDGVQDLSILRDMFSDHFGMLHKKNGATEPLPWREVLNKIIHAKEIEWHVNKLDGPLIVCEALPQEVKTHGWTKAIIRIDTLGTACGLLAGPKDSVAEPT